MSWAKFDDNYTDNLKVEAAGPLAELLDMRGIIHCARCETDGYVSRDALRKLGRDIPRVMDKVGRLVEVGRWESAPDGGWWIHDFLLYNPSKAQREAQRKRWREAKQKHAGSTHEASERQAGPSNYAVNRRFSTAESVEIPRGDGNRKKEEECPLGCVNGWLLNDTGEARERCTHSNVVKLRRESS